MKLTWKNVSTLEGLALTGQKDTRRGHVIVSIGTTKVKRYAFHKRIGDGRVTTRMGSLVGARACFDNGELISVVFEV